MKILTLCAGGNARSVTLATIIKYRCRGKYDVLAASIEKNTDETLMMLFKWADKVLVADTDLWNELIQRFVDITRYNIKYPYTRLVDKLVLADLGKDMWGMSMHPDLIPLACKVLSDLGFELKASAEEIIQHREKYDKRRKERQPYED